MHVRNFTVFTPSSLMHFSVHSAYSEIAAVKFQAGHLSLAPSKQHGQLNRFNFSRDLVPLDYPTDRIKAARREAHVLIVLRQHPVPAVSACITAFCGAVSTSRQCRLTNELSGARRPTGGPKRRQGLLSAHKHLSLIHI